MNQTPEQLVNDNNLCGEGPIWHAQRGVLVWNDMNSQLMFEYDPIAQERRIISRRLMIAGIALNADGKLVVAGATGFHLWRGQEQFQTLFKEHDGETLVFNDIIADARGRVYAGTVYWGATMEKTGKLYLINTDGSARVVDEGIELANGLAFSPDDRTLYFADSACRRIYAYRVDPETGSLSDRRVFVQVPSDEGLPDGLTVDSEGFIWSAQWYGSQVVRYDPDGTVERRIPMPVRQVSSVAFGGPEMTDLYITSAGEAWPSALVPTGYDLAATNVGGPLYRLRTEIQGRLEHQARIGM